MDTQRDFQTKRLLDMTEKYMPQFLAEFKRLNDMVLDILMNNVDSIKNQEAKAYEETEDSEPIPITPVMVNEIIDFHRITED